MTMVCAFLIGVFGGLRCMTAPAVTAWVVYLGWIKLDWPLAYIGTLTSVLIFTLLAVGELIVDKLPNTPSRTEPMGLIARIVAGGLCGACIAAGGGFNAILGAAFGAIGGVVGCFAGYQARVKSVKALGAKDFSVAVVEDLVAIGGSLLAVWQFR
jgi:uncharacterized membrane protein